MTVTTSKTTVKTQSQTKWFDRWWPVFLAVILLVGAIFRLGELSLMEFRHDSAYWALDAYRILHGGYLPLVGQQVGSVQVDLYNGPVLSYITALVFLLFGYQPVFMAMFIAMCNVAGIFFTFLLGQKLYSRKVGLIAALLMSLSPWLVLYGRMFWPQALFPALIPLSFLVLISAVEKNKIFGALIYGILLGVGLQLHLSIMALIGTGILYVLVYSHRRVVSTAFVSIGVAIGYSPIVIYDITHNFVNLTGLMHLPTLHAVNEPRIFHYAKTLWNFENILSGQALWVSKLSDVSFIPKIIDWGQGFLFSGLFILAVIMLVAKNFQGKSFKEGFRLSHQDALVLFFVIFPAAYLFLSRSLIQRHYFLFLYPLPLLIIGRGLTLWQSNLNHKNVSKGVYLVVPFVFILACCLNFVTVLYGYTFLNLSGGEGQYGTVLADKQKAVNFIRADSQGAYEVKINKVQETLPYVFLFEAKDSISVEGREDIAEAIYSTSTAEQLHQYEIIEPKYFDENAFEGRKVLYQSRGVMVLD